MSDTYTYNKENGLWTCTITDMSGNRWYGVGSSKQAARKSAEAARFYDDND